MIIRIALFYLVAASCVTYAWWRGGQPERAIATMLMVAAIATGLIPTVPGITFATVVWPLFAIDILLLAGLVAVALVADRHWPLYFCAIHLVAVALHGVRAYDPTIVPNVYARLGGELAYPTLLILVVGTWRHALRSPEPDWSWQIPDRSDRAA